MSLFKKTFIASAFVLPLVFCQAEDASTSYVNVPVDYDTLIGKNIFYSNGQAFTVTNGKAVEDCISNYKPKLKERANKEADKLPSIPGLKALAKKIIKQTLNVKQALQGAGGLVKINLSITTPNELLEIQKENRQKGKNKPLASDMATDEKFSLDGNNKLEAEAYFIMLDHVVIGTWPAKFTSRAPKTPRILNCPIKIEKANIACKRV
ncbi:MAG: hypothetical protein CMM87_01725 [Rickettsiales bacterium]|nr:hypothetical protein [Rickettsiales bacterium]|tara:strand:+ start:23051 stop:23674 length:624 start_codon:yes stop_codon:yes gene_type:complete